MEVKKDWLSGVLKVLLCFSFVYLWVMALVYVKKSYCGIPGAAVFLIAAYSMEFWSGAYGKRKN